jgi:cyclopropane fatty-acyl-phospholipid synthase-like methyltransferase
MKPPRVIPYERQTVDTPNPIARYAHRRRVALALALTQTLAPKNGRLLDFGAGTGHFLHLFKAARPDVDVCGVEPYMAPRYDDIRILTDFADVAPSSFDLVTAFEVCEHLSDDEVQSFVVHVARTLRPTGHVLISVPIMYGAVVPVKELSSMLLYRRRPDYSPREIWRAVAGRSVQRPSHRQLTHKGFDFRALRRQLRQDFTVEREIFSPFKALPWFVNSQAFFDLSKRIDA